MPRVLRSILPILLLFSIGLQAIVSPDVIQFGTETELISLSEEGDSTETPDSSKDILEDDDDTLSIHHQAIHLLDRQSSVEANRLNDLFNQHQPGSTVPPPRS